MESQRGRDIRMSILHPLGDSQTGSGGDRESIDSSRYSHDSSLRYSFTQEDAPIPVLPADLLSDVPGIQNRSHTLSDVSGIQNRSHMLSDVSGIQNRSHMPSDVSGIQNRSHMLSDVSGIQNRSHLQTDELPFESIEVMSPLAPTRG